LDNAEVEPTPLTLPNLLAPRAAPSISGQKRGSDRRGKSATEDTGTSEGGKKPTATTYHEEAMEAFLKAPFLQNASKWRVDHITNILLALLLEDPLRSATIGLICKSYSAEYAIYI